MNIYRRDDILTFRTGGVSDKDLLEALYQPDTSPTIKQLKIKPFYVEEEEILAELKRTRDSGK